MTNTIWKIVAALALLVSVVALYVANPHPIGQSGYGSLGIKLAENYDPYLKYNGGYYSALPIQTTSTFSATGLITALAGVAFGTNGTTISRVNTGACYFAPSVATIAATTTINIDCQNTALVGASGESALTGVTTNDNVVVTLSTSTQQLSANAAGNGLRIEACSASSTPGYITCRLFNGIGSTFTWPTTGTASGTASYVVTH